MTLLTMLAEEYQSLILALRHFAKPRQLETCFYNLASNLLELEASDYWLEHLELQVLNDRIIRFSLGQFEITALRPSDNGYAIDLLIVANGQNQSYAGAAATPEGFCRKTLESIDNAALEKWKHAVAEIKKSALPKIPPRSGIAFLFDPAIRQKLFAYFEQPSAYTQLIGDLLPQILAQSSFQSIINASEFYFKKAQDLWISFKSLEISREVLSQMQNCYLQESIRYDLFVQRLPSKSIEFQLADTIGQLISYFDGKAAGKQQWNQYEDKRTLANSLLRQNYWVNQLIEYKANGNNFEGLSSNVIHAIQYLENPNNQPSLLSERHRSMLMERLVGKTYQADSFWVQLQQFFLPFQLSCAQASNYSHLLSCLVYHPAIAELWKLEEENEDNYYLSEEPIPYQLQHPSSAEPLNQIFVGPSGTGKTYHAIRKAISLIEGMPVEGIDRHGYFDLHQRLEEYTQTGLISFISFHQAMSYEDFIEGIKPLSINGQLSYQIEDGIFKKMVLRAEKNPSETHVLVIDEINRGNVANIFGELISVLDTDKRAGAKHAIALQLPYSKNYFSVPSNLYILATMNSSDRSTEMLDLALRRRFVFIEKAPQPTLLSSNIAGINLQQLLACINERIERILDRRFALGHAYLWEVDSLEKLNQVFETQLIPLLEDYFMGDMAKIGLVLGKSFIQKQEKKYPLADFNYRYSEEITTRSLYSLIAFPHTAEDYISIYSS